MRYNLFRMSSVTGWSNIFGLATPPESPTNIAPKDGVSVQSDQDLESFPFEKDTSIRTALKSKSKSSYINSLNVTDGLPRASDVVVVGGGKSLFHSR